MSERISINSCVDGFALVALLHEAQRDGKPYADSCGAVCVCVCVFRHTNKARLVLRLRRVDSIADCRKNAKSIRGKTPKQKSMDLCWLTDSRETGITTKCKRYTRKWS